MKVFFGLVVFGVLVILIFINLFIPTYIADEDNSNSVKPTENNISDDRDKISNLSKREKLSFETIFSYPPVASDPKNISVLVTGDVMLGRAVNVYLNQTNNFSSPFSQMDDFIKVNDLTFTNLESPFADPCPQTGKGMTFCADFRSVSGLIESGIDVVGIANNHIGNYGNVGIKQTTDLLITNNILVAGNGQISVTTAKGKRFAFLAYNDVGPSPKGISLADPKLIRAEIQSAKKMADFVVVMFHWGQEYTVTPDSRQMDLAHWSIDSGADLVVGNHPHWVQGTEIYKEKFIAYSHGNFIFDQMWSQKTREGVVGKYLFDDIGLVGVRFYPVIIEKDFRPRFAIDDQAVAILQRMKSASIR